MDRTRRAAPIRDHDVRDQDRGGPLAVAIETDVLRRTWVDDRLGGVPFGDYAQRWLWRCAVAADGRRSRSRTGFLRAVLNTAVADGAIARNPCQIRGAGSDRAPERPVATPPQIAALADAISPRYRAAVLPAAWGGLRHGEILGLLRDDVDPEHARVTVRRTRTELLSTGDRFDAPPKTATAYRVVALPPHVVPDIAYHLEHFARSERVFVARDGSPMRGDALVAQWHVRAGGGGDAADRLLTGRGVVPRGPAYQLAAAPCTGEPLAATVRHRGDARHRGARAHHDNGSPRRQRRGGRPPRGTAPAPAPEVVMPVVRSTDVGN